MVGEASCSKTPVPLQSSRDPTQLAPGFRFHPTDEELVSYYLKRKVTGRPILVDAISEVDIYGAEPWDLPPLSRLRSRDLEWYFFTSLGRKYSNRCRTNRATIKGYWKTTGKDRPIQSRSRTIGMKKTLVYHVGRAPRGKRTNWVMHEYRLHDDNLSRSEIQQDAYVVCKIFEKTGAGPQNGAQYGAPFLEEEWEREEDDDAIGVLVSEARDDAHMDPGIRGFVQLDDFLLDQESSIQHLDAIPHSARSDDADYNFHTESPSNFLVESLKEQGSDGDMPPDADSPTMQYNKTSVNRLGKQKVLESKTNPSSIQNNAYLQLKDIFGEENTSSILNIESADCFLGRSNNNSLVDEAGNSEILPQDAGFINQANQLSVFPDIQHDNCLQMDNLDNMAGQSAGFNLVYFDAICHEVPCLEDGLTNETSLTPKAEFDFLDELMAYYDSTDDNLNYPPPSSFQPQLESSASSKVVASSSSSKELHVQQNLEACESLRRAPSNEGPLSGWNDNLIADPKLKDCEDKTLTKRLSTLLNAISAPPALADEATVIGKIVGKTSSSSTDTVHVTAGMIRIQSLESWKLENHSEMNILLSYGVSESVSLARRKKTNGGFITSVCWVGFHLFLLCSCALVLSCKLGACVSNLEEEEEEMAISRLNMGTSEEITRPAVLKSAIAEFFSTILFVFASQGSSVSFQKLTGGGGQTPTGLLISAISNSFALSAAVAASANNSGGHINPAITFAIFLRGHISLVRAILYIAAQLIGSIAAAFLLEVATGAASAAATPSVPAANAVELEGLKTFGLVMAVCGVAGESKLRGGGAAALAPLVIGFAVGANVLVGGSSDGAVMNPAATFGRAVVGWAWDGQWVCWAGEFVGGGIAGILYEFLFGGSLVLQNCDD